MDIVVADANIFVYLFRCQLLSKLLSNDLHKVVITDAVFDELTNTSKRISREHPTLRQNILSSVHNTKNSDKLQIISIDAMTDLNAVKIYYELEESGELDLGEIESIPLTLDLDGIFVSHDADAIEIANQIKQGLGVLFLSFCKELVDRQIFSTENLGRIEKFLEQY